MYNSFRDVGNYLELHLVMKIPISIIQDSNAEVRRYKYHVESSSTENNTLNSLEFISGPKTRGDVIDRSLKLYCKYELRGKQD